MSADTTQPARAPIDVVGALIVREGTVLAAQRGPDRALAGMWEFPGGKVEAGEDAGAALAREIHEELACEVTVGAHVTTTVHAYDFGIVRLSTYFATLRAGMPIATEHTSLRWVPIGQLFEFDWAPADVPTVYRIIALRDLR